MFDENEFLRNKWFSMYLLNQTPSLKFLQSFILTGDDRIMWSVSYSSLVKCLSLSQHWEIIILAPVLNKYKHAYILCFR